MFHDTFYQNKYTFTLNSITNISLQAHPTPPWRPAVIIKL